MGGWRSSRSERVPLPSPCFSQKFGKKLCFWHPKPFCLGWTSSARQLPPMTTRLWDLVEVLRRVWERCRWSELSERFPVPSPFLSQKFWVSRSKTLSLASKILLSGMDQLGQAVVADSPNLGSCEDHTEGLRREAGSRHGRRGFLSLPPACPRNLGKTLSLGSKTFLSGTNQLG